MSVLLALCSCGPDYNPFADPNNAGIHISSHPFGGKDTVPVFSTGEIGVAVLVREQVSSLTVEAEGNRFWADTIVHAGKTGLEEHSYRFRISFADTGTQAITLTATRSDGERESQSLTLYCTSPLYQRDLRGTYGESLRLHTPRLDDPNLLYHWDLDHGRTVSSPTCSSSIVVTRGPSAGAGQLWVSDLQNRAASPKTTFSYTLGDTSPPVILCLNTTSGDTVYSSDSVLVFKALITDRGDEAVDSSYVNNQSFDIVNTRTNVYTKLFHNMAAHDRSSGALTIRVGAIDNLEFRNTTTRTFHALYDPSAAGQTGLHIQFVVPSRDSTPTSTKDFPVFGTVENYAHDTIRLQLTVNGNSNDSVFTLGRGSSSWEWVAQLDRTVNTVTARALSQNGEQLAKATRTLLYDPSAADQTPPLIWQVTAEGTAADHLYTTSSSVKLEVVAFDEGSGIRVVTVGDRDASSTGITGNYRWQSIIDPLLHVPGGNPIQIRATDRTGNVTDTTITIYRNSRPTIQGDPGIPQFLFVDSTYEFLIGRFDADNDRVLVTALHAPPAMSVSGEGIIRWRPDRDDLGEDSVVVQLYDGYEYTRSYSWRLRVVDPADLDRYVRFSTTENDFPVAVQAGRDTMRVHLRTKVGTGTPPMNYSARSLGDNRYLLDSTSDSLLHWAPTAAEIGEHRLMVTVTDDFGTGDTIYPMVTVVPRNQHPCSLSYVHAMDTTTEGYLNMSNIGSTQAILFTIHDADHPLTEEYIVRIRMDNLTSVELLDTSTMFRLELEPDDGTARDTVRVVVEDATGTTDSVTLYVRYALSSPTDIPQLTTMHSASSGITLSGSGVREWKDAAGGAVALVQSDNDHYPTYMENAVNGLPALKFTQSEKDMLYDLQQGDWENGPFTAVFVFKPTSLDNLRQPLISTGADDGFEMGITCTKQLGIYNESSHGDCPSAQTRSSDLTLAANNWYIAAFSSPTGIQNGRIEVNIRRNGVKADSTLVMTNAVSGSYLVIGGTDYGNSLARSFFDGYIAEVVIYERELSATERSQLEHYLSNKYEIALGSP